MKLSGRELGELFAFRTKTIAGSYSDGTKDHDLEYSYFKNLVNTSDTLENESLESIVGLVASLAIPVLFVAAVGGSGVLLTGGALMTIETMSTFAQVGQLFWYAITNNPAKFNDKLMNPWTLFQSMDPDGDGEVGVKTPNTGQGSSDADFYVGPDGTITKSLDAYDDFLRMKGMSKHEIVNQILNGERIGSGLKDDAYHRAASFLTREQLMNGKTTVFGGKDVLPYIKLETSGALNGVNGTFEYILNSQGQVTHQLFIPYLLNVFDI